MKAAIDLKEKGDNKKMTARFVMVDQSEIGIIKLKTVITVISDKESFTAFPYIIHLPCGCNAQYNSTREMPDKNTKCKHKNFFVKYKHTPTP